MRPSGRNLDEIRDVSIEIGATKHAEGSCLIKCGATHVLCTASLEQRVPPFLKNTGLGWVTAEYGMLPRATHTRMRREAAAGKQSGRTQEIQRLIGRSLRAAIDRSALGERQITIDWRRDTGRWRNPLRRDHRRLGRAAPCGQQAPEGGRHRLGPYHRPRRRRILRHLRGPAGARPRLRRGTSEAGTDSNFVMTGQGALIEVQASAEGAAFSRVGVRPRCTIWQPRASPRWLPRRRSPSPDMRRFTGNTLLGRDAQPGQAGGNRASAGAFRHRGNLREGARPAGARGDGNQFRRECAESRPTRRRRPPACPAPVGRQRDRDRRAGRRARRLHGRLGRGHRTGATS